jgi:hypothetical protein
MNTLLILMALAIQPDPAIVAENAAAKAALVPEYLRPPRYITGHRTVTTGAAVATCGGIIKGAGTTTTYQVRFLNPEYYGGGPLMIKNPYCPELHNEIKK